MNKKRPLFRAVVEFVPQKHGNTTLIKKPHGISGKSVGFLDPCVTLLIAARSPCALSERGNILELDEDRCNWQFRQRPELHRQPSLSLKDEPTRKPGFMPRFRLESWGENAKFFVIEVLVLPWKSRERATKMAELLEYLDQLTRETKKSEAELMSLAFQSGVRQLWREHILGRYLRGEISRESAVDEIGAHWIDLAEQQRQAMMEDLAWALQA